ncbi:MAG TPA: hypothetical protein VN824_04495 [Puia sp.]|nr:hypothetical protein [Puia sp.]
MFLLLVNLYEFGQFLRILLWISVPMFIVAMLVTTWLHYRRRRKTQDQMALAMEGLDLSAAPEILIAAMKRGAALPMLAAESELAAGEGAEPVSGEERETIAPADAIENMYKGILWMKEKYEQYRDMADQRIEELKEQVARAEKKYEDLLAGRAPATTSALLIADQRIETAPVVQDESLLQQQLAAKDRQIEELVAKLQTSSQLLLNLSQELEKTTLPQQPQA